MGDKIDENGKRHWTENFRIFTPILVTIAIFLLGTLNSTVNKIDDKLFKHLTNDEIHIPRGQLVSRDIFDQYTKTQERDTERLYDKMCIIEGKMGKESLGR